MHSFLVAFAYLAMIFAPCAVAQWGDVLTFPRFFGLLSTRRRRSFADPLLTALSQRQQAAEMAMLYNDAFVAPAALPRFTRTPATFDDALASASTSATFQAGRARVAACLAAMVEAHRLANTVIVPEATEAFATPTAAELDALYAPQTIDTPARETATTATAMHLLPPPLATITTSPPESLTATETPPIAIAA